MIRPGMLPGIRSSSIPRFPSAAKWKAQSRSVIARSSPSNASHSHIQIAEEVREAIKASKPVVALESAIYTHGFPTPENAVLASHLEAIVRAGGGVPATVGVLDGVARVGMKPQEISRLTAAAGQPNVRKVSRRDLAYVCGLGHRERKLHGGTTISATALLAEMAGIRVFATGGLGGVHRGAENTLDVSSDLTELGRTNIAVVCSGCKGFLDIPKTLEYLETQGVSVMTFLDGRAGRVDFPAFWTRDSGISCPLSVKDEAEAAQVILAQQTMGLQSGLLLANPIPTEHSIPRLEMEHAINKAIKDAESAGLQGYENTPFILNRIRTLTKGRAVNANRALVESNVARATRVAIELLQILSTPGSLGAGTEIGNAQDPGRALPASKTRLRNVDSKSESSPFPGQDISREAQVVVAGSIALDVLCDVNSIEVGSERPQLRLQSSNPARVRERVGGVGTNVATALHYLGVATRLCSIVGTDASGESVLERIRDRGFSLANIRKHGLDTSTPKYVAVNDEESNLLVGMADFDLVRSVNSVNDLAEGNQSFREWIGCTPKWFVIDANWNPTMLQSMSQAGKQMGASIAYEPVSVAKAGQILDASKSHLPSVFPRNRVDLATPNAFELGSMFQTARDFGLFERDDWFTIVDGLGLSGSNRRNVLEEMTNSEMVNEGIPQQTIQLLPYIPCILTTLGNKGVLLARILRPDDASLKSDSCQSHVIRCSSKERTDIAGVYMRHFPPHQISSSDIVSVNGAGDTFLGALIACLTRSDHSVEDLVDFAQSCAVLSLRSADAVNPAISSIKIP